MLSRWLLLGIACLLSYAKATALRSTRTMTNLGVNDLPQCGVSCIGNAMPAFGCSLSDVSCLCTNNGLRHALADCMLANCTMYDTLNTLRVQRNICNLSTESNSGKFFIHVLIVYSLIVLFLILRLAGKWAGRRWSNDDYTAIFNCLLVGVPVALICAAAKLGFADHTWNLEHGALRKILLYFWLAWPLYTINLGLIKVSVVLFYIQIFHTAPHFKRVAYGVLGYIVVNTAILWFVTVFVCRPVSSFWNQDIKGTCMNLQALSYASSACSIVQDVILLVLPLFWIRNLQMKTYRKVGVALMFGVGSFGLIATFIRLKSLLTFKRSIDPTWDYVSMTWWSELELAAAFLCLSLPAIRVLMFHMVPARLKRFLSYHTPTTPARPTDLTPSGVDSWRKPASWVHVSDDVILEHGPKGGFLGSIRSSGHKNHFSARSRSEPKRTESAQGIHSVPGTFRSPIAPSEASRATDDTRSSIELVQVHNMDSERMDIMVSKRIEHMYEEDLTAIPNLGHSAKCSSRQR
ncbi:hypothetical protein BKA63DRAFT_440292 [Paraphoma chrysanthemicola]|nr:hypothetical protein BKA63DRAFT_440292 [Paraphoma chrysanthemicola]